MSQKSIERADQRVADKRRVVEDRLADLRLSIDREVRFMPKGQGVTLPLIGFACGLAMARRLFGDRR